MHVQQLRRQHPEGPWLSPVDRPVESVPPNHVQVTVDACGVCRTDLQLVTGDLPARRLPIVPGHQVVGRIVAVGAGVARERLGQPVGLVWLAHSCGVCRFCKSNRENLCLDARFTGWDVDGGYGDTAVAHADFAFDLSPLLAPDTPVRRAPADVAPLLCGGVIGYRALRVAGVGPGDAGKRLGLYGFGASARLAQQAARHWGVETYVVSRSEPEIQAALAGGASWAGHYGAKVPVALDAAITFAPVGAVVIEALRALDRGGIVAINAIHLDGIPAFDYDDLWWERQIRSVANVTRADVSEFLALVGAANITTDYETLPLAAANEALARLAAGKVRGSFVLDCSASDAA